MNEIEWRFRCGGEWYGCILKYQHNIDVDEVVEQIKESMEAVCSGTTRLKAKEPVNV